MILTPRQQDRIGELSDQWSFFWDKRRSLWLAAEDCPDGNQLEESDLDTLLIRLSAIAPFPARRHAPTPDQDPTLTPRERHR